MKGQVYRAGVSLGRASDVPPLGPGEDVDIAAFRSALREWLDAHDLTPPGNHRLESLGPHVEQLQRVRAALYEAGWMRYGWPAAVGGYGGPALLRAVLGEEVAARDLADPGIYSMIELGSTRELTREAGRRVIAAGGVPRLVDL